VRLFAFDGKWVDGAPAWAYYDYQTSFLREAIPRHRWNYSDMDEGMVRYSDGMVPYYSACPGDVVNEQHRRLISTIPSVGMAHDDAGGLVPKRDTETHIAQNEAPFHGAFLMLTNLLGGGDISAYDARYDFAEPVPQTKGVACKEFKPSQAWSTIRSICNGKEYPVWQDDNDKGSVYELQDKPYSLLIGPVGTYQVYEEYRFQRVSSILGVPAYSLLLNTNVLGSTTVVGGEVTIYDQQ